MYISLQLVIIVHVLRLNSFFDMAKRIRLSISPEEKRETDWTKCFICQVDKHEALMSPTDPSDKIKLGYTLLA